MEKWHLASPAPAWTQGAAWAVGGRQGLQRATIRLHVLTLLNLPLENLKKRETRNKGDGMNYPEAQTQDLAESCIKSYEHYKQSGRQPRTRNIQ